MTYQTFRAKENIPVKFADEVVGKASVDNTGNVIISLDKTDTAQRLNDFMTGGLMDHLSLDGAIQPADVSRQQSNLVDHARRELALLGEEQETIDGYLKVIRAFVDMGHSGGSASVAIPAINHLLQFKNLKPLTDDPNEWIDHGDEGDGSNLWQSVRNAEAFSHDGGKTYYLLSEGASSMNRAPLHESEPYQS